MRTALMAIVAAVALALVAPATSAADPYRGTILTQAEIDRLGPPPAYVLSAANGTAAPTLANQDSAANVQVFAAALVYAKQGGDKYLARVCDALRRVQGTEAASGSRGLSVGRELGAYVAAADLVDAPQRCATEPAFRSWLAAVRTKNLPDGRSLVATHEQRPNNWGTMAGWSRMIADAYLGDTADLERAWQVFRGFVGDRAAYAGFKYGELSWQANPAAPIGINPAGAMRGGVNVDGAPPDDARRCGVLRNPPCFSNYIREGQQGTLMQAYVLARAGYPALDAQDAAVRRVFDFVYRTRFASGPQTFDVSDDAWQIPLADRLFGLGRSFGSAANRPGKNLGYTAYWAPVVETGAHAVLPAATRGRFCHRHRRVRGHRVHIQRRHHGHNIARRHCHRRLR